MRNIILMLVTLVIAAACSEEKKGGDKDITTDFKERWNINEEVIPNSDGTITYKAMKYGGLVANYINQEEQENWTPYSKIIFEFTKPTSVITQIVLNEKIIALGSPGITSLSSPLKGFDVTDVKQVALQSAEPTTITVKRVLLKEDTNANYTTLIWDGECVMGNWTGGMNVTAEMFKNAEPGNVLEIVYTTDTSSPSVFYWQLRTIYSGEEITLEGNANELNEWGCATMPEGSTNYRITLTETDVEHLKKSGLYINGYYTVVNQVYLLQ